MTANDLFNATGSWFNNPDFRDFSAEIRQRGVLVISEVLRLLRARGQDLYDVQAAVAAAEDIYYDLLAESKSH